MNKQELLKTAVIALNGKLSEDTLFTKQKFEQKAKEMGYVNGYRYGVEYPTNGKKPDLPDDVQVAFKCENLYWVECEEESNQVQYWKWENSTAFRIIDLRYKPSDTSYLVEHGMKLVNQIQEKLESVTEKLEANSWWDYENDKAVAFPPAGTLCLVYNPTGKGDWLESFIVGTGSDRACVFDLMDYPDLANAYDGWLDPERFRPLDYFARKEAEKDALIKEATEILYKHTCATRNELIDGARALYDMGYLKVPSTKEE